MLIPLIKPVPVAKSAPVIIRKVWSSPPFVYGELPKASVTKSGCTRTYHGVRCLCLWRTPEAGNFASFAKLSQRNEFGEFGGFAFCQTPEAANFASFAKLRLRPATVAQLAEQSLRKRRVVGSSPTGGSVHKMEKASTAKLCAFSNASGEKHRIGLHSDNPARTSSSPTGGSLIQ